MKVKVSLLHYYLHVISLINHFVVSDTNGKLIIPSLKDAFTLDPKRIVPLPHFSQQAEVEGVQGKHNVKGRFEIGLQYHYTMEPQTCVCVPIEDGMDVYSSTQWMDM